MVIGMGLTDEDASMPANQLLGVGISALSKDYCNEQFGARNECLIFEANKDFLLTTTFEH